MNLWHDIRFEIIKVCHFVVNLGKATNTLIFVNVEMTGYGTITITRGPTRACLTSFRIASLCALVRQIFCVGINLFLFLCGLVFGFIMTDED